MGVIWRRGAVRLSSIDGGGSRRQSDEATRALADRREGARAGPWTRPSERDDLLYEPVNFGVVTSVSQTGGASAMYLGLAKERNPRAAVRPTFLEQTDVEALAFDFGQRTLTLSRNPLVRGDAIPLLDLRPLGAPVAQYTAAVHKLVVNGEERVLTRPCVAVIDTGTSGLVVSDSLYDSDELPLPGAAMRTVEIQLLTERGRVRSLRASRRPEPLESSPPVVDRFPLIVTPVHLGWFDRPERRGGLKTPPLTAGETAVSDDASLAPHVLFVGLAFLSETKLGIDCSTMRMAIEPV